MKKILTVVLTIFMMFSIGTMAACKNETTNNSSNSVSSDDTSSNSSKPTTLTESELKAIVIEELYDSLSYNIRYGYITWNYKIDPSSCRYSTGSIKKVGSGYEVNGVCYFYDKYGNLVSKYSDGSGGYSESFTVKISSTGSATLSWE